MNGTVHSRKTYVFAATGREPLSLDTSFAVRMIARLSLFLLLFVVNNYAFVLRLLFRNRLAAILSLLAYCWAAVWMLQYAFSVEMAKVIPRARAAASGAASAVRPHAFIYRSYVRLVAAGHQSGYYSTHISAH